MRQNPKWYTLPGEEAIVQAIIKYAGIVAALFMGGFVFLLLLIAAVGG